MLEKKKKNVHSMVNDAVIPESSVKTNRVATENEALFVLLKSKIETGHNDSAFDKLT